MALFGQIKGVAKTLFTKPVQSFKTGVKEIISPSFIKGKNVSMGTAPFGVGGAVKVGVSTGGKAINLGRNILNKIKTQGGLGTSATWGQFIKGTGKILGASGLGYYAATGKLPTPSLRGAAGLVGYKLNPFGAGLGIVHGVGETITTKITDIAKDKAEGGTITDYGFPEIPQLPTGITQGDTIFNMPSSPQMPMSMQPSGFNISVGGGESGMSQMLPLLLALGVIGGTAYAIKKRKRKRKKKKYKKRRNYD